MESFNRECNGEYSVGSVMESFNSKCNGEFQ